MALVCDYCGDVTQSSDRVSVAFGHNQEIALKGATAREWFFYCDDECADAVKAMLDNLRLFAMHGEGSGLMWSLVEQEVAPVAEEVKPAEAPALPPIEAQPKGEEVSESQGAMERKGRLPLTWWLQRQTAIPITELSARQSSGTPVTQAVTHIGSQGNLHKAGIATLEDAAALTEVEFAGLPGVGVKILAHVTAAMKKYGLSFKPGPTLDSLGAILRDYREGAGVEVDALAVVVATSIGAPERRADHPDLHSNAVSGAEQMIRDAERGAKAPAPAVLDVLAEAMDVTRPGILAKAMEVSAWING